MEELLSGSLYAKQSNLYICGGFYMFRDRRVEILKEKVLFRKSVPQKKQKAPNIINNEDQLYKEPLCVSCE